jgi:hypothetical protein
MEAQIQTVLARVADLEAENAALRSFHATPDAAAASDSVGVAGGAGDTAKVAVDSTTRNLMVSAATGATVQVGPILQVGKFTNVEQTLARHAANQAHCTAKLALLEATLVALNQQVATLTEE